VVGEVGSSEPPTMMALGEALDGANELRKAAAEQDKPFAISEAVYRAASLEPPQQHKVTLRSASAGTGAAVHAFLSESVPVLPAAWMPRTETRQRVAMLQRLWRG